MNYIILIIAGIAGVILGTYLARRRRAGKEWAQGRKSLTPLERKPLPGLIKKQAQEKEENKRKITEFFGVAQNNRVTNDDIENLLGVSDATATRYLDELGKEGLIRQIGKTGRHVYYEKVK